MYFVIERVLSSHFVWYCKVRCLRSLWGGVSDAFLMFREAEYSGPFLTFNMTINPSMILKNVTVSWRADASASKIQRAWREALYRPER
jgi:hypothetical protein